MYLYSLARQIRCDLLNSTKLEFREGCWYGSGKCVLSSRRYHNQARQLIQGIIIRALPERGIR